MSLYRGIENIDQIERLKQHELTKSLWQKLSEMGVKTGDKGRIKGYLVSKSYEHAMNFKTRFQHDFNVTIHEHEESSTKLIECTTPISRMSLEALVELADILMIVAVETDTIFDGLELNLNEIKKLNPPWWKFW